MKARVVILTLIFLSCVFVYSYACTCMLQHPQEHYCHSDFVILARIKRERVVGNTKFYKVRVRKEYKISEKGVLALKSGILITSKYGSMCGVDLVPGKLYVLSGNIYTLKAHINLCGMTMEWDYLTKRQRRGFKLLYSHGCNCEIRRCRLGRRCHRNIDGCNWRNECETKEGVCLRKANKSCMWTKTKALVSCTKEWRKNVTSISTSYR